MPAAPQPSASSPSAAPPLISVVIPAWNRRETLRMSVESVLRQTFTDFELIVVDDGSTDGTMEAIADLADPRIRRLAHEVNKGVSAARNTGIRAARGEWVAFQDSDDEWLPRKLEKQMARLEGAGPEVVACYTGMVTARRPESRTDARTGRFDMAYMPDSRTQVVEGDLRAATLSHSLVSTQMLMARRTTLLEIGGFDETLPAHEDRECVIRLARAGQFAFVDEPLVVQNFSANSLSRDMGKRLRAWQQIVTKHHEALSAHPQVLVSHLVMIAGLQRRMGDVKGARASLAAAARVRPFSLPIRLRQLRLLGAMARRRA